MAKLPDMLRVASTNIKEAGYDAETQTMFVRFESGLYSYPEVPAEDFEKFAETFQVEDSSTKYLNKYLRDQFPPSKVEPEKEHQ